MRLATPREVREAQKGGVRFLGWGGFLAILYITGGLGYLADNALIRLQFHESPLAADYSFDTLIFYDPEVACIRASKVDPFDKKATTAVFLLDRHSKPPGFVHEIDRDTFAAKCRG